MKKFFWAIFVLTVVSCKPSDKLPEGYMDQEEMVSFLIDLHTAQAAIQHLRLDTDSAAFIFKVYERKILEDHNSTDSVFYKSFSWYLDRPDLMFDIYTAVVDSLSLQESLSRRN